MIINKTHIVLIGASVGQGWRLPDFPVRMKDDRYTFNSVAAWQYDKTDKNKDWLPAEIQRALSHW